MLFSVRYPGVRLVRGLSAPVASNGARGVHCGPVANKSDRAPAGGLPPSASVKDVNDANSSAGRVAFAGLAAVLPEEGDIATASLIGRLADHRGTGRRHHRDQQVRVDLSGSNVGVPVGPGSGGVA